MIWRNWFRRRERRWLERRVSELLGLLKERLPDQPFILYGRWSWTSRDDPLEVHVLFPYVPVAFHVLSWYDRDRVLCWWFSGDFEQRSIRLSRLQQRAERISLPLVLVEPNQVLDGEWLDSVLKTGDVVS